MITRLRTTRWLLSAAVALVVGCGEPESVETTGAAPTPTEVPPIETPLVAPPSAAAALPEDFPEDVTYYSGAELIGAVEEGGKLFVQTSTSDDYESVMEFYQKDFTAKGWTAEIKYDVSDPTLGGAVFAEKGGRAATVFVTNNKGGGSLVDIFIEPEGS